MRYNDVMDPSRTVIIESEGAEYARCRVYFDGVYFGRVNIALVLLRNTQLGFRPVTDD